MGDFWDARAREDAFYFVENRLTYGAPDTERFWSEGPEIVDAVLGAVGAPAVHGHAVEIGCGIGRLTRVLAARADRVTAIDVSREMVERARRYNPGLGTVDWVVGDGTAITGVRDADADLVFSHVVFQHLPDPAVTYGYVRDMGRVLRPGGHAVFHVSDDPRVHRARSRLRPRLGGPRGVADPAWLGSAVDLGALAAAARAGGLEVRRVAGAGTQFCYVLLARSASASAT